jgi:hypothetical protein
MIRLSPRLLIGTASAMAGIGSHPDDHEAGTFIDRLRAGMAEAGESSRGSWDVALIDYCGYWSHFDFRLDRTAWPVPRLWSAPRLALYGEGRNAIRDYPEEGDIFLQFAPRRRDFIHAGIVVAVFGKGRFSPSTPYYDLTTIEGDVDECGRLGGGVIMRARRRLSPVSGDRFLRWTELDGYDRMAARMFTIPEIRRCA